MKCPICGGRVKRNRDGIKVCSKCGAMLGR